MEAFRDPAGTVLGGVCVLRSSTGVPCVAALFVAALSLVVSGGGAAVAQGQPPTGDAMLAQAAAITFNIPAQPLASALTTFGRQAGLQVLVDSASVAGKTSAAVNGSMTAPQALQQLLGGTSVPYRFTSATAVMVGSGAATAVPDPGAMQLDPVQVQGFPVPAQAMIDNLPPPYAGGQVATGGQVGLLGNRGVMDTPFAPAHPARMDPLRYRRALHHRRCREPDRWPGRHTRQRREPVRFELLGRRWRRHATLSRQPAHVPCRLDRRLLKTPSVRAGNPSLRGALEKVPA
jgi:hypothetical protein